MRILSIFLVYFTLSSRLLPSTECKEQSIQDGDSEYPNLENSRVEQLQKGEKGDLCPPTRHLTKFRHFFFGKTCDSRDDRQRSRGRQTDETFQGEEQGREEKNQLGDNRLGSSSSLKFSNSLMPFKNGSFMMNTYPGYPGIVKIISLLVNMFKPKRKPEIENQ